MNDGLSSFQRRVMNRLQSQRHVPATSRPRVMTAYHEQRNVLYRDHGNGIISAPTQSEVNAQLLRELEQQRRARAGIETPFAPPHEPHRVEADGSHADRVIRELEAARAPRFAESNR